MKLIRKYYIQLVGLVLGIVLGYAYYNFIGCRSGSCAITSNPYMSMIWGGLMGYLLLDMVANYLNQKKEVPKDTSEPDSN